MDPKVLLDYINIWYEDPNTPIDDLKLPPSINHMVATFINEAKWKEQQARQAKVAKIKKEKFLGESPQIDSMPLVTTQAELQKLTDKYAKLSDRKSIKSNLIKLATSVVDDYKRTAPSAPTPHPLVEEPADATPHEEETPQAEKYTKSAVLMNQPLKKSSRKLQLMKLLPLMRLLLIQLLHQSGDDSVRLVPHYR
ncbi:hypothetical protein ZWY2020_048026 [Hordeum vulgare]|nr:hypothetical protein ZWY2020_048026 [Hordeum vulgare]